MTKNHLNVDDQILYVDRRTESNGVVYLYEYCDATSFEHLPKDRVKQAYGVCFVDDKLLIGYGGLKKGWGLIGGSVEPGETFEQTLKREIKEESNMELLAFLPIGYQKLTNTENGKILFQLRYACKVRPLDKFTIDGGDGTTEKAITKIELIDPSNYKQYFDWGEIGEHIIQRALNIKSKLN